MTKYLGAQEVAAISGLTAKVISSYACTGRMPEPDVTIGVVKGWTDETIKNWIDERAAKADARVSAAEKTVAEALAKPKKPRAKKAKKTDEEIGNESFAAHDEIYGRPDYGTDGPDDRELLERLIERDDPKWAQEIKDARGRTPAKPSFSEKMAAAKAAKKAAAADSASE